MPEHIIIQFAHNVYYVKFNTFWYFAILIKEKMHSVKMLDTEYSSGFAK